jgi:hypothetical protein
LLPGKICKIKNETHNEYDREHVFAIAITRQSHNDNKKYRDYSHPNEHSIAICEQFQVQAHVLYEKLVELEYEHHTRESYNDYFESDANLVFLFNSNLTIFDLWYWDFGLNTGSYGGGKRAIKKLHIERDRSETNRRTCMPLLESSIRLSRLCIE